MVRIVLVALALVVLPSICTAQTAAPHDTIYVVQMPAAVDSAALKQLTYQSKKKDPGVAVLLGLLIPGAGSFYAGDGAAGAVLMVMAVVGVAGSNSEVGQALLLGAIIASPIAGGSAASEHNRRLRKELGIAFVPNTTEPGLAVTVHF